MLRHAPIIAQFIVEEFLPDMPAGELAIDLDLVNSGVIDSLGLLKLIAWLEDHFGISADDTELSPEHFRSIEAIDAFVVRATTPPVEAK